MSWLFGGKKKETTEESMQKMNDTVDLLRKREGLLMKKMEKEQEQAKMHMKKGNKTAALLCLKRKKQYEDEVMKINGQISNLDSMQIKLDRAVLDMETLKAQQTAANAMQDIFKKTNVDKVDSIMDKIRDTMDDADDISNAISQPLGVDLIDEGALEDELEALENEMLKDEHEDVTIPKTKLPQNKTATTTSNEKVAVGVGGGSSKNNEDDELARLQAELGL